MTYQAAIYARYSDKVQNPILIEDHVSMCRKHDEAQGWTVTTIYADAAMTGRTANRPEFIRMRQDAADKAFDIVVVEAVNRVSSRVVDSLQNWELLTFSGVVLIAVCGGDQNFLNVMLNALGAQMFSEKIAEHTRRGLVGTLERNGHVHSLAFGYRKVEGQKGVRGIDPETAPVVLRIFAEAANGVSGDDIARGLNRDSIPAPQGGIWYASTIRGGGKYGAGLLRKTIYAGTVTYGRTENRLHPETGARRIVSPPDKRVEKEIPELRIVPQKLWDRVQARLDDSAQAVAGSSTRNPRPAHRKTKLLSGLLKCGCCGTVMPPNLAFQLSKVPSDMRFGATSGSPDRSLDTWTAAQVCVLRACLVLAQDADDLFVRESRSLPCPSNGAGWGGLQSALKKKFHGRSPSVMIS